MVTEQHLGTRIKDGAGHFGEAKAYRHQLRCAHGDAVWIRWESAARCDSWEYAASLEPARAFAPRGTGA